MGPHTSAHRAPPTMFGFKRHFFVADAVLAIAEMLLIAFPISSLLVADFDPSTVTRISLPSLVGMQVVWWFFLAIRAAPLNRATLHHRRDEQLSEDLARQAYRVTWVLPGQALLVRVMLWALVAGAHGLFWLWYRDGSWQGVVEVMLLTAVHAFVTNLFRVYWYQRQLARLQERLFFSLAPMKRFADGYVGQLAFVAVAMAGATAATVSAFVFFSFTIEIEQYLRFQQTLPAGLLVVGVVTYLYVSRARRVIDAYLLTQATSAPSGATDGMASRVYRRAQSLPYRLAGLCWLTWVFVALAAMMFADHELDLDSDDSGLLLAIFVTIATGSALYQALWHREILRPILDHVTTRHRLPIREVRASSSLRAKLLLYFGGMAFFAVSVSLIWAFIQYKNVVTRFTDNQVDLGLAWLRSEVKAAIAKVNVRPSPSVVERALDGVYQRSSEPTAVFYYLPSEGRPVVGLGGGPSGAPVLPWYLQVHMRSARDTALSLPRHAMTGRKAPLVADWGQERIELGHLAVFYPTYRGRGASLGRPILELVVFFFLLFGVCAGIVGVTVGQFVKPIRRLEQRADGMARGELGQPVSSGGEGDEVGRLTFALEEMRRALQEKLRSTEEVNLDLERAVQRRTSDLAKKNSELAETLEKLTLAQDQLVQAEKMASIGQLVAGIAHEINNPVNAIANTVGPLGEAIEQIQARDGAGRELASRDAQEMIRVVQRGAARTKAIVQALHNYSRTDDDSVVAVDINRSLDDSLELLRHLLKGNIVVERNYGEVGKIVGHAGQLNQVFMNLLTNAAQAVAGREGARIRIETDTIGSDEVAIKIADNGRGISDQALPRIFDPFFTTKDVGQGSGLGLSIVHGIVERHGGRIAVQTSEDAGTTFTVRLPRESQFRFTQ